MHVGDLRHVGKLRLGRRLIALPVVLALAAGGCGGGSTGADTTAPTASAPEATAPPADATQPGTSSATTPPATTTQPAQTQTSPSTGGARNVHVRAAYAIAPHWHVRPRTITVPAFVAVNLSLRSPDTEVHWMVLDTPEKRRIDIMYRKSFARLLLPGMRPGRYQLRLDGHVAGALVVGGEAGP